MQSSTSALSVATPQGQGGLASSSISAMRVGTIAFASALLLGITAVMAANAPEKAQGCLTCHGQTGVSQTENIPSVAAQPTLFTQWQLVFYRIGRIKNEMMGPIAAELSDDDVRELGAYLSTLPPPKPADQPDDAPALTEAGKQLRPVMRAPAGHAPLRHEPVQGGLVGQPLGAAAGVDQVGGGGQRHLSVMGKKHLDSFHRPRLVSLA